VESSQHAFPLPPRLKGTVRRPSSNLIPSLLLLPAARRADALLFSDWCRLVDDITDDPSLGIDQKKIALEAWLAAIDDESGLPEDFHQMIRRRNLDRRLLSEIIRGMLMDVVDTGKIRYATFPDLEIYCRRVASAVGLISARIFGANISDEGGAVIDRYANHLGIALQLTNILRDVAEDASLGRIYIPQEDLERFGVSNEELLGSAPSPAMTHLLNHQAERADSYFAKAELAWTELTPNQRRLMRPARLMSAIYRDLLLQMHRDRYDVFAKQYRVPFVRKYFMAFRVITGNA
jgi:phytoene synthase